MLNYQKKKDILSHIFECDMEQKYIQKDEKRDNICYKKLIKIYKKDEIDENLIFKNNEKNFNKLLDYIDLYYLNKIDKLQEKYINATNIITKLRNEFKILNKKIKEKGIQIDNITYYHGKSIPKKITIHIKIVITNLIQNVNLKNILIVKIFQ